MMSIAGQVQAHDDLGLGTMVIRPVPSLIDCEVHIIAHSMRPSVSLVRTRRAQSLVRL